MSLNIFRSAATPDTLALIKPLYATVYAEEPYREGPKEVEDFVSGWNRQTRSPDFRIVLATEGEDLAGFSYGFPLGKNSQWWKGLIDPADASITTEAGNRTFAIIELVVRSSYRRRGIGRALHDELISGCRQRRSTLTVRPEAAPALAAYEHWGYKEVGRLRPWPEAPIYMAMIRDTPHLIG